MYLCIKEFFEQTLKRNYERYNIFNQLIILLNIKDYQNELENIEFYEEVPNSNIRNKLITITDLKKCTCVLF